MKGFFLPLKLWANATHSSRHLQLADTNFFSGELIAKKPNSHGKQRHKGKAVRVSPTFCTLKANASAVGPGVTRTHTHTRASRRKSLACNKQTAKYLLLSTSGCNHGECNSSESQNGFHPAPKREQSQEQPHPQPHLHDLELAVEVHPAARPRGRHDRPPAVGVHVLVEAGARKRALPPALLEVPARLRTAQSCNSNGHTITKCTRATNTRHQLVRFEKTTCM